MPFPRPVPGLIVRYSYLWADEHDAGRDEGRKDRPYAIVVATEEAQVGTVVTVVPITHTSPADLSLAMEIPAETKRRLGLDADRSWIVFSEANRFVWPVPDLRAVRRGRPETAAYGLLPQNMFLDLRNRFVAALRGRKARAVARDT